MVTISNLTLRANIFETLYDIVSGITFTLSSGNSVRVTAAFVDDEETLPQVVVHRADVNKQGFTFNRSTSMQDIQVVIEVFTGLSKGNKDLDQITDTLVSTLEAASTPGIQLVNIDENSAMSAPANVKIKSKTIGLTYTRCG